MTFLPEDYELPSSNGDYMKLEQGENKFRILSDSVIGYEVWYKKEDSRAVERFRTDFLKEAKAFANQVGEKKISHFWAFRVWNYNEKKIQIYTVTQKTIQESILASYYEEAFGDPKGYDIKINREGEGKNTKYQVQSLPPSPISEDIEKANLEFELDVETEMFGEGDIPDGYEAV